VIVAGQSQMEKTVLTAGYEFWPCGVPPEEEENATWEAIGKLPNEEANGAVMRDVFAGLMVRATTAGFEAACEEWRPDVILREPYEFAAAVVGERRAIPHARIAISLASFEEISLAYAAQALEEYGGLVERIRESPYLTLMPPSLEGQAFAQTHRYRDPGADGQRPPLPAWWGDDQRPLLYVTFGSLTGGNAFAERVYSRAIEAVAELPVRVLLTVGKQFDTTTLGELPANVRVEPWVPQADVFAEAAAVVCHGGSGTTVGALAAGLPLVIAPLFADQPHNARRVAAVGAGIEIPVDRQGTSVSTGTFDSRDLREAVETVLGNTAYAKVAEAIRDEIRDLPPTDAAIGTLEALTEASQ
jgi:UDP:flavonoid glycosyltransferase YjiC (YdhE family)